MAKEKPATEVTDAPTVEEPVAPQLSAATLAEQELGRKMAAANALTLALAEKARAEEKG